MNRVIDCLYKFSLTRNVLLITLENFQHAVFQNYGCTIINYLIIKNMKKKDMRFIETLNGNRLNHPLSRSYKAGRYLPEYKPSEKQKPTHFCLNSDKARSDTPADSPLNLYLLFFHILHTMGNGEKCPFHQCTHLME